MSQGHVSAFQGGGEISATSLVRMVPMETDVRIGAHVCMVSAAITWMVGVCVCLAGLVNSATRDASKVFTVHTVWTDASARMEGCVMLFMESARVYLDGLEINATIRVETGSTGYNAWTDVSARMAPRVTKEMGRVPVLLAGVVRFAPISASMELMVKAALQHAGVRTVHLATR